MDLVTRKVLETAVNSMADFKNTFGRDLSVSILAELYVALELDLSIVSEPNTPGFDLLSEDRTHYQIKHRSATTLNVDINNFDFDYLVLVNMSPGYRLTGMWQLDVEAARSLFVHRAKYRKYQATQKAVKNAAKALVVRGIA